MNRVKEIIKQYVLNDGIVDVILDCSGSKFLEDKSDEFKIYIDSKQNRAAAFGGSADPISLKKTVSAVLKCVMSNKSAIEKEVKSETGKTINISSDSKLIGGTYFVITLK